MFGKDDKKDGEPKKSLYQRFQDRNKGEISEADVAKYTGMNKSQLSDWAQDRPGVGGNQAAGKISAGPASGVGGINAGEGFGGWGTDARGDLKFPPRKQEGKPEVES
ncbi:hypothetical protein ACHAQA_002559 [Verticillium albo-atrum]